MWDIVVIEQDGDSYIVMTPNGDVHSISKETFQTFEKAGRVSYNPEHREIQIKYLNKTNMKKFKLIKTYPGSPKLGTIAEGIYGGESYTYNEYSNVSKGAIEDYPEYWEEIIEE